MRLELLLMGVFSLKKIKQRLVLRYSLLYREDHKRKAWALFGMLGVKTSLELHYSAIELITVIHCDYFIFYRQAVKP